MGRGGQSRAAVVCATLSGDGALQRAKQELSIRAEKAGRDPATIPITVFLAAKMTTALLDEYAAANVARVVQFLPPDTHDEAMTVMNSCAPFLASYA